MPAPRFVLGRSAVVLPDQGVPTGWDEAQRVRVGDGELAAPASVVEVLHGAWLARRPVVVELACDPTALRSPECFDGPVYDLDPGFEFARERLQFLVWTNSYDLRAEDAVWWHARKAARRIVGVREGGSADLVDRDGRAYFVDGGPPDPPEMVTGTPVVHRFSAEAGALSPVQHGRPSAQLAGDQLDAVAHPSGGARVLAPAGSGKTRVLTERLRHLIADRCVHPSTVTAVAFNKRAADEMRQRLPGLATRLGPHVRTLNALGLWVCNEFGGDGRLEVLDESGARSLIEHVFSVRHQANADTVAPYLDALSGVRLGLSSPHEMEARVPDAVGLAGGFDEYREALHRRRLVDFDEQIYRAIEILLQDPHARSIAQRSCRRMLVDEFQDLTPAHLLLIRLLCAPGYDCFGVGDDDQVIYGYSGADPGFLIDFGRYFPGAGTHALEVNYRCPPAVVEAATTLLSYNTRRVRKSVRAAPGREDPPSPGAGRLAGMGELTKMAVAGEDAASVALDVIAGWIAHGIPVDDVAVLARVHSALLPVHVACIEAGVPVSSTLGPAVLRRTGVRTALAYLRIAQDPGRITRADLLDTINRPSRKISRKVAEMLGAHPASSVKDIRRLAARLTGNDAVRLRDYADDLDAVAARTTTGDALRTVRLELGLGAQMESLDASHKEADRSTHADDLTAIEAVAALHPRLEGFEAWLTDVLSRTPAPGPSVVLSTVHKIKGKEWPRVIVFGANQGLFPHRLSDDDEGERRVLHVAITRAQCQAVVLFDRDAPSPFLAELDGTRLHAAPRRRPRRPDRATTRRVSSTKGKSPTRAASPRRGEVVTAAVGLEVAVGGQRGSIAELRQGGVLVRAGSVRFEVSYGTQVLIDGRVAHLGPHHTTVDPSADTGAIEQALRDWRSATSRADKVPAYIIVNDADLRAIAERAPGDLTELGRCRGMGPLRLERYGDEILGIIDEHRGDSALT